MSRKRVEVKMEDDDGAAAAATAAVTSASSANGEDKRTTARRRVVAAFASAKRERLSMDELKEMLGVSIEELQEMVNSCLGRGEVLAYEISTGKIELGLGDEKDQILATMDREARLVYQEIKKFGNKGVWWTKLRSLTGLDGITVSTVMEKLKRKRLIREFRSIQEGKKKMVMLADLQPDASIDGGPWYNPQNKTFDVEYVNTMRMVACKLLRKEAMQAEEQHADRPLQAHQASLLDARQLFEKIEELDIFEQKLAKEDLSSLLDTLVSDGYAIAERTPGREPKYRYIERPRRKTVFSDVPCFTCPVRYRCASGGIVSPEDCIYFQEWSVEKVAKQQRRRRTKSAGGPPAKKAKEETIDT